MQSQKGNLRSTLKYITYHDVSVLNELVLGDVIIAFCFLQEIAKEILVCAMEN